MNIKQVIPVQGFEFVQPHFCPWFDKSLIIQILVRNPLYRNLFFPYFSSLLLLEHSPWLNLPLFLDGIIEMLSWLLPSIPVGICICMCIVLLLFIKLGKHIFLRARGQVHGHVGVCNGMLSFMLPLFSFTFWLIWCSLYIQIHVCKIFFSILSIKILEQEIKA